MRFEIYRTTPLLRRPEWRWRLKATNGEIIASGEGYRNKADAIKACDLIRDHAAHATISVFNPPARAL